MTTGELGHDPGQHPAAEETLDRGTLGALFDNSPARKVHTSAAAEIGFVAGLLALLAMPFSLTMALCLGLSAVGLVTSVVGMARASRTDVAGGLLASVGVVLSLATSAVVGMRYLGIDTALGDSLVPALEDSLRSLNTLFPKP